MYLRSCPFLFFLPWHAAQICAHWRSCLLKQGISIFLKMKLTLSRRPWIFRPISSTRNTVPRYDWSKLTKHRLFEAIRARGERSFDHLIGLKLAMYREKNDFIFYIARPPIMDAFAHRKVNNAWGNIWWSLSVTDTVACDWRQHLFPFVVHNLTAHLFFFLVLWTKPIPLDCTYILGICSRVVSLILCNSWSSFRSLTSTIKVSCPYSNSSPLSHVRKRSRDTNAGVASQKRSFVIAVEIWNVERGVKGKKHRSLAM